MTASLGGHAFVFLFMCLSGFVVGVFYDIFRVFRRMLNVGFAATAFWDLLFWFMSIIIFFYLLLYINFGELRMFIFLGIALGLTLYFITLSRLFLPPTTKFALATKNSLRKSVKYVKIKGANFLVKKGDFDGDESAEN